MLKSSVYASFPVMIVVFLFFPIHFVLLAKLAWQFYVCFVPKTNSEANIAIPLIFRIREFTTWAYIIHSVLVKCPHCLRFPWNVLGGRCPAFPSALGMLLRKRHSMTAKTSRYYR